jgi:hypothetical protein
MQRDPVFQAFLSSAAADAAEINRRSRSARLVGDPRGGRPTDTWHCLFEGLAYLRREAGGRITEARDPVAVRLRFPDDYLGSADPVLGYRVITLGSPVLHPNARGSAICLAGFRMGLRLRSIVEQLHAVLSCRAFATTDPLDPEAARVFADHPERIAALHSSPLWPEPVARASRVRAAAGGGAP